MKQIIFIVGLLSFTNLTWAQSRAKKDTSIFLMANVEVQLETSKALNDLYNFQFAEAEKQFLSLREKYPWHPLPPFLMALSYYWKILPNTREQKFDEPFLAYLDSTIVLAENLYDHFPDYKLEATFFLAASHGFKGSLYSDEERKNWRKAAVQGKAAIHYMNECSEKNYLSPEFLFGDGLYNYFSVWIPENYAMLKPILWFFKKGNKELGLQQLNTASSQAFYARIEAMVWLMRIMNNYEHQQEKAFQLGDYLYKTFPKNPYFHRYYARLLYARGLYGELEKHAKQILQKVDSAQFGYEATAGRYASFYLGQVMQFSLRTADAEKYYKRTVQFAEQNDATESGYCLYALISLGEMAQKKGDKKTAKEYFKQVKKYGGRKDAAYQDAKKRLKTLEKM